MKSGAAAFRDTAGNLLDGDADNASDGDLSSPFTVASSGDRIVSIPDMARGAGQPVNIPNTAPGLPIRISNADGVLSLAADLAYDEDLLDITAATLAAGLPGDWRVVNPPDTSTPGVAKIRASGATALSGTNLEVVRLIAVVPSDASYGDIQAIRLENVSVNDGVIGAVGDVAAHKAVYLVDADGSGIHSSADAFLTVQAALGLASGFSAHAWTDPRIVGDADGSGVLSAADAFLIVQVDVPSGISAGADTARGWVISATLLGTGHLRVEMASATGRPLSPGLREIAWLKFHVAASLRDANPVSERPGYVISRRGCTEHFSTSQRYLFWKESIPWIDVFF